MDNDDEVLAQIALLKIDDVTSIDEAEQTKKCNESESFITEELSDEEEKITLFQMEERYIQDRNPHCQPQV